MAYTSNLRLEETVRALRPQLRAIGFRVWSLYIYIYIYIYNLEVGGGLVCRSIFGNTWVYYATSEGYKYIF